MASAGLMTSLQANESFRGLPYIDSLGHGTIGLGTKLPITEAEADILLVSRVTAATNALQQNLTFWNQLTGNRQDVFSEMAYILGVTGFLAFHNMLAAAAAGDIAGVCREMQASLWAQQEPNRVAVLVAKYQQG